MIGLLLWLAGCIFGAWALYHWHLWRDALAVAVAFFYVVWVMGGATYFSRRARKAEPPRSAGAPAAAGPKA